MSEPAITLDSTVNRSFTERHFSPENRLAEIICGLVMVLTFTATTGAACEGTTPHGLLRAVLGCNIAWGIVTGMRKPFDALAEGLSVSFSRGDRI